MADSKNPKQNIADVFDDICSRVSAGELLTDVVEDYGFKRAWFYKWLNTDQSRVDDYAHARVLQQESWADDIVRISEDSNSDTKETANGEIMDGEWVARCKLKIDTKKWLMAKLAPRTYGDKIEQTHKGELKVSLLDQIRDGNSD